MNPTATTVLDQAGQELLNAVYAEHQVMTSPVVLGAKAITADQAGDPQAAFNFIEEHGMEAIIDAMQDSLKASERRKMAIASYCQARSLIETFVSTEGADSNV